MAIEAVAIEASLVYSFGPKGMINIVFTQHLKALVWFWIIDET
jgi:hypothetical protein